MASFGHVAVGLAAGRYFDPAAKPLPKRWAMFWMAAASLFPDADVIAFFFGIPYAHAFGHRGASHALLCAPLLALLPAWALDTLLGSRPRLRTWLLTSAVVATHGLLDALTDGGLGVALLWPLTDERFFAPWRPLPVAPIGLDIVSTYGLRVVLTELLYFAPLWLYALWPCHRSSRTR